MKQSLSVDTQLLCSFAVVLAILCQSRDDDLCIKPFHLTTQRVVDILKFIMDRRCRHVWRKQTGIGEADSL